MEKDDKKSENYRIVKKDFELINRLSVLCSKYNCTPSEVLIKLKEIKGREVKDE